MPSQILSESPILASFKKNLAPPPPKQWRSQGGGHPWQNGPPSKIAPSTPPPPSPVNNRDQHPLSKIASSTPPPPPLTIATSTPCPPPPSTISWPPHHYFWPHPGHPTEKFLATPLPPNRPGCSLIPKNPRKSPERYISRYSMFSGN